MLIDHRTIEIAYRCVAPHCRAQATITTNVHTREWIDNMELHPTCPIHRIKRKMIAVAATTAESMEFVELKVSYEPK